MLKDIRFWAGSAFAVAVIFLACWLPGKFVVPVLMYHSIGIAGTERDRANTVSPGSFDRQMRFIKESGYRVLTVDEYVEITRSGGRFPPKSVVITFDDGLLDNFTNAYPVLIKYGIPSAMFVPSAYVGQVNSGWGQPQMSWDQLRAISAHGVTVGSHTSTHRYLPEISPDAARGQIVDSKAVLEGKLGRRVDYFAYPSGGFSEGIKAMVREAGYKAAFTTNRGEDRSNRDLYELKRIRPKDTDGSIVLWMKLSGYYNLIRDAQNPY